MLQRLQRRLQGEREGGFTLIELMVVVLIIAILIAIAIPTFLGARQKAQDRAAQSNLRNALTAAKTVYTDKQTYSVDTVDLTPVEPSLTFQAASTQAREISVVKTTNSATVFYAAAKSASGTCFYITDNVGSTTPPPAGTSYGKVTPSPASCAASAAPTGGYSTTGW
jgi:type IV pilus assembly protein PilA